MRKVIKNDLGEQWELINFEIKDFTKKGDNYMTAVTGISCTSTSNGMEEKTFYVAKLNPSREISPMNDIVNEVFMREGIFLADIAIKLNDILQHIKYSKINLPKCIYYNAEKGQEILISKDLRRKGYKMVDKKVGMDIKHSELLVKELAKLHASSHIFKSKLQNTTVLELYPNLRETWLDQDAESRWFEGVMRGSIGTSIKMLQGVKEYSKQCDWLKNLQTKVGDVYANQIKTSPEEMRVICHGDCWNNNVVFRYDDEGNPLEITLLDLQVGRFASLALDLNYFFYTSLTGDTRRHYLDHFLSVYFQEFSNVMASANMEMPFTKDEFRREVQEKVLFGIISGLILTPFLIGENENAVDLQNTKAGETQKTMEGAAENFTHILYNNPIFKDRFLLTIDDIIQTGIIDKKL